jgi:hypothetical protein
MNSCRPVHGPDAFDLAAPHTDLFIGASKEGMISF